MTLHDQLRELLEDLQEYLRDEDGGKYRLARVSFYNRVGENLVALRTYQRLAKVNREFGDINND